MSDDDPSAAVEGAPPSDAGAQAEAQSKPRWHGGLRRAGWVALLTTMVLLPLWLRAVLDGRAELAAADEAGAQGRVDQQVEHLGHALRWRAPLASHDEDALEQLWAIAQEHEARGDEGRELSLAAYREIRGGLLATRALDLPHRDRFEQANEHIAALMAQQEAQLGLASAQDDPTAFHRELLAREPGPDPLRADLAALAFLVWVGCVAAFAVRGIDARGRLHPRAASRWGLGALLSLVAWAVLLVHAHG